MSTQVAVGDLLKHWRARRRISQFDLALEAGVSPKHLSFVETGRSKPSPELLLSLARHLDVPLRAANGLLLAAGYAPRYRETSLGDDAMAPVMTSLRRLLDAHQPYPGVVIDRYWDVILANDAAGALVATLPSELRVGPINMFRVSLHPDGFAARTRNLADWGGYLVDTLRRLVDATADPRLVELEREIGDYPTVRALEAQRAISKAPPPQLLVPFDFVLGEHQLSMFTTLTTFGTPRDITLEDVAVELFFPADDATAAYFQSC